MRPERVLEHLACHQAQVAARLDEARRLLRGADAAQLKALALVRWELARLLREHQLFKHAELFDPLIAAGGAQAVPAGRLKARCLDLAAAYEDHVRRWSLGGPAGAWSDYRRDALAMAGRIEQHLAGELAEVRLLLAGVHRTRRP